MDWGQKIFEGMYKATSLLVGVAAHKSADVPGLFSVLLKLASVDALPKTAGIMTNLAVPSFYMNLHSAHAVVLFAAIRAVNKYDSHSKQLRAISEGMSKFNGVIASAIDASRPVPPQLPSVDVNLYIKDPEAAKSYTKQVNDAIHHVRAFVAAQDVILNDIDRCVSEWNQFLEKQQRFLKNDKPRNIFEQLQRQTIEQDRMWVQFDAMTDFGRSVSALVSHRNLWSKLLDLPRHAGAQRVKVAN